MRAIARLLLSRHGQLRLVRIAGNDAEKVKSCRQYVFSKAGRRWVRRGMTGRIGSPCESLRVLGRTLVTMAPGIPARQTLPHPTMTRLQPRAVLPIARRPMRERIRQGRFSEDTHPAQLRKTLDSRRLVRSPCVMRRSREAAHCAGRHCRVGADEAQGG